jgi:hypothetical protein
MFSMQMMAALTLLALTVGACSTREMARNPVRDPPLQTQGTTSVVDPSMLPAGHPAVPIADPVENANRVGRAPRRLSVDQLRASLLAVTGYTWVGRRTVPDPSAPTGTRTVPNADMLEELASTLGRADFLTTTSHSLDPSVTFSKLANDAARVACRQSVAEDAAQPDAARRRLLREVGPTVTLMQDEAAVRRNIVYMARRFWGRVLAVDSAEVDALVSVFRTASTTPEVREGSSVTRPAGSPVDGWRAVCIAMATDPQFLTY